MAHVPIAANRASIARPHWLVLALSGDPSVVMSRLEAHTARKQRAAVVWVVMNNSGRGVVVFGSRRQFKGIGRNRMTKFTAVPIPGVPFCNGTAVATFSATRQ